MKRQLKNIKQAYEACIPQIIVDGEIKDDDICQAIEGYEAQLGNYEDTDALLAVKYVNALSKHINLLVSYAENDSNLKRKSPWFYNLVENFLQQYSPGYESKYLGGTGLSFSAFDHGVEHKHAYSSSEEYKSPRSTPAKKTDTGSVVQPSLDHKYEQKTESRPNPAIQPVIVNEKLQAAGAQFRQQIRNESVDGVARLLNKHGFLPESKEPSKVMAYQLLTEGYKKAPNDKTQIKAPEGDFELAKRLQDEEIGRVFKP